MLNTVNTIFLAQWLCKTKRGFMKKSMILLLTILSLGAYANDKTETKVIAEFPCEIQETGNIRVTEGVS